MITVVVGKEIEKIKGDYESYLNGLNMVGEISYSQYSELYDEGTKQIQKAYELGKSELEQANKGKVVEHFEAYGQCRDSRRIAELEQKLEQTEKDLADYQFNYPNIKELEKEIAELKTRNQELLESCEGATMMYKDLCKAKELLKQWVLTSNASDCDVVNIIDDTEQFLDEVKK